MEPQTSEISNSKQDTKGKQSTHRKMIFHDEWTEENSPNYIKWISRAFNNKDAYFRCKACNEDLQVDSLASHKTRRTHLSNVEKWEKELKENQKNNRSSICL